MKASKATERRFEVNDWGDVVFRQTFNVDQEYNPRRMTTILYVALDTPSERLWFERELDARVFNDPPNFERINDAVMSLYKQWSAAAKLLGVKVVEYSTHPHYK